MPDSPKEAQDDENEDEHPQGFVPYEEIDLGRCERPVHGLPAEGKLGKDEKGDEPMERLGRSSPVVRPIVFAHDAAREKLRNGRPGRMAKPPAKYTEDRRSVSGSDAAHPPEEDKSQGQKPHHRKEGHDQRRDPKDGSGVQKRGVEGLVESSDQDTEEKTLSGAR